MRLKRKFRRLTRRWELCLLEILDEFVGQVYLSATSSRGRSIQEGDIDRALDAQTDPPPRLSAGRGRSPTTSPSFAIIRIGTGGKTIGLGSDRHKNRITQRGSTGYLE